MFSFKPLNKEDVTFELTIEAETHIPVRGNALASGDDAEDKACEDEIIARVDSGDMWAWCCVRVVARWNGFTGDDYLGCCSYADETDFKAPGSYYDDMCAEALARLNEDLTARFAEIAERIVQS